MHWYEYSLRDINIFRKIKQAKAQSNETRHYTDAISHDGSSSAACIWESDKAALVSGNLESWLQTEVS